MWPRSGGRFTARLVRGRLIALPGASGPPSEGEGRPASFHAGPSPRLQGTWGCSGGIAMARVVPRRLVLLACALVCRAGLLAQVPPPRPEARPRAAFRLAVVTSGKDVS